MNQEEDRKARALVDACTDHTRGTMVGMAYEAVYALAADVVRLGLIAEDHDCLVFPWDNHAPSRLNVRDARVRNDALEEAANDCDLEAEVHFERGALLEGNAAKQCACEIRARKVSAPEKNRSRP